ncbi:MAG: PAS domain S-box protein, partial [Anaerolineae bacterium]|nr:PAS domain S-box protein [Anaerolineae bacterium]
MHILKRWPPAKIRILLLLLLAVGMLLYECWLLVLLLRTPSDQIGIYYGENIIVRQVPQDSSLQVNDVILKIGPLETNEGLLVPGYWHTKFLHSGEQTGATYLVRRGTETLELNIPWQKVPLNDLLWRGGTLWAIPFVTFIIVCLILLGRGQDRGARLLALFFTFMAYIQLNNLFPVSGANLALIWGWLFIPIDLLAVWLCVSTYLYTFLIFPEVKTLLLRFPRLPVVIYAAIPVILTITALASSRTTILGIRDAIFVVFNPLAILMIIAGLVALGHTYRTSRNPGTRNQILWIFWGLGLGILPWIAFYALPSTFLGKPWLPLTVTNLTGLILPVVFMVAIFRYGLLDIEFIINRTLVYGVAAGMLVVVYMAAVSSARAVIFQTTGAYNDYLAGIAGALIVFVVYNPLRLYIEQGVARTFYRDHLDFQAVLREISETLSTTILLSDVLNLLTYQIADRLGLVHATLVLLDNGDQKVYTVAASFQGTVSRDIIGWLHENNMPLLVNDVRQLPDKVVTAAATLGQKGVEVCLPLRHHNELLGLYLFGHKQSGALLSRQDIDTLVLLSHHAAAALQNAQLYRELQTYNRELEVRIQERAADLLAERNRLDTIVQNISDGLVVTDLAGRIVLFNPAFERILGINSNQIRGFAFSEVVDSDVLEQLIAVSLTHPGEVFTDYFTTMLKQGHNAVSYVYKTSACALVQRHKAVFSPGAEVNMDNIQGVVTVLRDVTHEYEVDRMKTEFISTVSHELRTPLTSVLGFAKL